MTVRYLLLWYLIAASALFFVVRIMKFIVAFKEDKEIVEVAKEDVFLDEEFERFEKKDWLALTSPPKVKVFYEFDSKVYDAAILQVMSSPAIWVHLVNSLKHRFCRSSMMIILTVLIQFRNSERLEQKKI